MTTHIFSKLNIRKTHPGLYRSLMSLAVMDIALAANFWFTNPTFNPYGIPKNVIGTIFCVLGIVLIFFLNAWRDLHMIRIVLAVSIGFMFFWGCSNAEQFFAGKSSLQLPILFVTLSFLQIPLLTESPVNPMTKKE